MSDFRLRKFDDLKRHLETLFIKEAIRMKKVFEAIYMYGCLAFLLFGLSFVCIIYGEWIREVWQRRLRLRRLTREYKS